jgi:hypothetical protein
MVRRRRRRRRNLQPRCNLGGHRPIERVQLFGPVQLDRTHAVVAVEEHIVRVNCALDSRWGDINVGGIVGLIWLARAARYNRSTGTRN